MSVDFVCVGDIITLESSPGTFLSADVAGNLLWDTPPDSCLKYPANFNRCQWKVCERLSYVDQELRAQRMARAASFTEAEMKDLELEAAREAERNIDELAMSEGFQVLYGRMIQLQHMASGKFLTAKNKAATFDRDCLGLQLTKGSSMCYFSIQPKYKVRAEGGQVLPKDEILLTSGSVPGYNVHESKGGQGPIIARGLAFNEANMSQSRSGSALTINVYARYTTTDWNKLKTGQSFRLFDRELDGFLHASCFTDGAPITPAITPPVKNPKTPAPFVSSSVWCIETLSRTTGGLIVWDKPQYRIKHVPSGLYLTVGTENYLDPDLRLPMVGGSPSIFTPEEMIYSLTLDVDEGDPEGNPALQALEALDGLIGKQPPRRPRQIFEFRALGQKMDNPHVPLEDIMVVLVHTMKNGLGVGAIGGTTELFFHAAEFIEVQDGNMLNTRVVYMSSIARIYDALLLVAVPEKEDQSIRLITDSIPALLSYRSMIEYGNIPESSAELEVERFILSQLVCYSFIGDERENVVRSAMTIDGPADIFFQHCAREQLLLDALVGTVVAPLNATLKVAYSDKNPEKVLKWEDPRFESLIEVHRLAWRALLVASQGNALAETHLIKLKIHCKSDPDDVRAGGFGANLNLLSAGEFLGDALGGGYGLVESSPVGSLAKLLLATTGTLAKTAGKVVGRTLRTTTTIAGTAVSAAGKVASTAGGVRLQSLPSIGGGKLAFGSPFGEMNGDKAVLSSFKPPTPERPAPRGRDVVPFISVIGGQIAYPLGAAEVLTSCVANSRELQKIIVTKELIHSFKNLIRYDGPAARFLAFFHAICSCQGEAVLANQNLCLSELVLNQDDYSLLMVQFLEGPAASRGSPASMGFINSLRPVKYLGKEVFESAGYPAALTYTRWSGDDHWTRESPALYYSPTALLMKAVGVDGQVPLEELCWPLDKERLCARYTGVSWDTLSIDMELNKTEGLAERFQHQLELAGYVRAQIDLFAEMLNGEPYTVILVLEKIFPFSNLVTIVSNNNLPYVIRGSFVKLMRRLWLERYPHEQNCGLPCIPMRLWVYESLSRMSLVDSGAIPRFQVHELLRDLLGHSDAFYNIPTANKFAMLNLFTTEFFSSINRQAATNLDQNHCIAEVIALMRSLLNRGFYPTASDIVKMVSSLVTLLDGRVDVLTEMEGDVRATADELYEFEAVEDFEPIGVALTTFSPLKKPKKSGFRPFSKLIPSRDVGDDYGAMDKLSDSTGSVLGLKGLAKYPDLKPSEVERYKLNENTYFIMQTKREIIGVLNDVCRFRDQFRLSAFLMFFKEVMGGGFAQDEIPVYVKEIVYAENTELNLDALFPVPVNAVLLDLMMYDDEDLFESAFNLLCNERECIQRMLDTAKEVTMLDRVNLNCRSVPDTDTLALICSDLRRLIQSAPSWSDASSAAFNEGNYNTLWDHFDSLLDLLRSQPSKLHQKIILLQNIHPQLFKTLNFQLSLESAQSAAPSAASVESLVGVCGRSMELLTAVAAGNLEVQREFAKLFADLLVSFKGTLEQGKFVPALHGLIIATYSGTEEMIRATPAPFFRLFGLLLHDSSSNDIALKFFQAQLTTHFNTVSFGRADASSTGGGKGEEEVIDLSRNQSLVFTQIEAAMSGKNLHLKLEEIDSNEKFLLMVELLDVLALCVKNNTEMGFRITQSVLPWEGVAEQVKKSLTADPSATDFGLGIPAWKIKFTENANLVKSKFVAASINFVNWSILNPASFDDRMVTSPVTMDLVKWICKTIIYEDIESPEYLLAPKNAKTMYDCREKEMIAKLSFLNAFIATECCSNMETCAVLERAAKKVLDQDNFVSSSRVKAIARQALLKLKPGDAELNSLYGVQFRPGAAQEVAVVAEKEDVMNDDIALLPPTHKLLKDFIRNVSNLEKITKLLRDEKVRVLQIMLTSAKLTDPNETKYVRARWERYRSATAQQRSTTTPLTEIRTNTISWNDLLKRFLQYIDRKVEHSYGSEEGMAVCVRVLELLCIYLEDGKQQDSTSDVVDDVGDATNECALAARQLELMEVGVNRLVYRILKHNSTGVLVRVALKLGALMLDDHNIECQADVYKYMHESDNDGVAIFNMRTMLKTCLDWVRETRFDANRHRHVTVAIKDEVVEAVRVLKYMKYMCAGHFLPLQNALRDQSPFNRQSFNLVEVAIDLLEGLVPRIDVFRYMQRPHMLVLHNCTSFLVEALQGPCVETQSFVAKTKLFLQCKVIMGAASLKHLDSAMLNKCKLEVVTLLSACLENRHKSKMEESIAAKIDKHVFDKVHVDLYGCHAKDVTYDPACDIVHVKEIAFIVEERPVNRPNLHTSMRDLHSLRLKIARKVPSYDPALESQHPEFSKTYDAFKDTICCIEVNWQGHTEDVYFPKDPACEFLSLGTRLNFLSEAKLSTPDMRVKSLLESSDDFFDEMEVYYSLSLKIPGYSTLAANFYFCRILVMVLALLINIDVILSFSQFTPAPTYFDKGQFGVTATVNNITTTTYYEGGTVPINIITCIIGLLLLAGYLLMLVYWALPVIPMHKRQLDRKKKDYDAAQEEQLHISAEQRAEREASGFNNDGEAAQTHDWSSFSYLAALFVFYVLILIIHYHSTVPRISSEDLLFVYACMGLVIFGIGSIVAIRSSILVPTNSFELVICLVLDVATDINILVNSMYFGLTVAGLCGHVYCFTLLMLDYVFLSQYAMDVVRSVIRPWKSLLSILAVFLIVVEIFGVFGITQFGYNSFLNVPGGVSQDDATGRLYVEGDLHCNSMVSCLGLVFSGGLRASDIAAVMEPLAVGTPQFGKQLFFIFTFFITVGVLLFNMVTGIIVDTFSSLRAESDEQLKILEGETFVSGLTREKLEEEGIEFEMVQEGSQHAWNYIFFLYYLRKKDKKQYDGVEKFISDCLLHKDFSWFPHKTCMALERSGSGHNQGDDIAVLTSKVENLQRSVDTRLQRMEAMISELVEASKKPSKGGVTGVLGGALF